MGIAGAGDRLAVGTAVDNALLAQSFVLPDPALADVAPALRDSAN